MARKGTEKKRLLYAALEGVVASMGKEVVIDVDVVAGVAFLGYKNKVVTLHLDVVRRKKRRKKPCVNG